MSEIANKMTLIPENFEFREVDSLDLGSMQEKIDKLEAERRVLLAQHAVDVQRIDFWKRVLKRKFKPLFIPLTRHWYDEFASGRKRIEYRKVGKRWNLDSCFSGREVVLSCGYGKSRRMKGLISNSWVETDPAEFNDDFRAVYGESGNQLAIRIDIMEDGKNAGNETD